jgi:hypothetical protein
MVGRLVPAGASHFCHFARRISHFPSVFGAKRAVLALTAPKNLEISKKKLIFAPVNEGKLSRLS